MKRRAIFLAIVFGTVVTAGILFIDHVWWPSISIVNNSDKRISDVLLSLSTQDNPDVSSHAIAVIEPGETAHFRKRTSDLYFWGISFRFDSVSLTFGGGSLACPGEEILLSIESDGRVRSRHNWSESYQDLETLPE